MLLDQLVFIHRDQLAFFHHEFPSDHGEIGFDRLAEDCRSDGVMQRPGVIQALRLMAKKSAHLPASTAPMSVRPSTAAPPRVASSQGCAGGH